MTTESNTMNIRSLAAAWFVALAFVLPARAASVLPLFLDEMVDTSAVAFQGTCTGNRTERDPATHLVVTYTTFEVHDVLKGNVGATHEIKQVGGTLAAENLRYRVEGIPTFTVGEEYVVFLAGVSSAGFSSPIGLEQGRFSIRAQAAGRSVSNGRDLREMTSRMQARIPAAARTRMEAATGPVRDMDLEDFKQAVRNQRAGQR